VSALATYRTPSGKRRRLRCPPYATPFSATRAPVFCDLRTSQETIRRALKRLLGRGALAGLGCVLGGTEAPGLAGLRRAAQPAKALTQPLRRPRPVRQVPLDERWSVIARTHARETDAAGARLPGGEAGWQGGWGSLAPACRVMSAAVGGPRPLDTAQAGGAATKARGAGLPAVFSAGCTGSRAALIAACHGVMPFAPTGKRGRPRPPGCAPPPALRSGQLGKQKTHGTLLTLSPRGGLGAARLTHLGLALSPAWVERGPLPLRQALAPWGRKTSSVCTDRERLRQRVGCLQAFSHVGRPPMRVRRPLPLHERIRHGALCPRWPECTPRWPQA
jgi:hypothetical protein